jgi:RNA polymerase sigma-70 factor (ECF subfamily)
MNPLRSDKPNPQYPERTRAGGSGPEGDPGEDPCLSEPMEDHGSADASVSGDDTEEAPTASQQFPDDRVEGDMAAAGTYSPVWGGSARESGERPDADLRSRAAFPVDDDSDAAIMLRVREGDTSGFTYLIEKHRRQIVHYMFRMTNNLGVAEELAQEVFLRVYRSRESYRAEAKFTTWLYRIATNLGVNYARDHRHEKAAQSVYLDQPDAETGTTPDVADSRQTVEQKMIRDERMAGIRAQVMSLPERQRQAVLMHKYQEMDYREIGAILKLSESATKSLLFRAYQSLRERLKDYV